MDLGLCTEEERELLGLWEIGIISRNPAASLEVRLCGDPAPLGQTSDPKGDFVSLQVQTKVP